MGLDFRLLQLIKPHRRHFAATIALGLAIGVLTICQARVLSCVISQVFLYKDNLIGTSKLLVWLLLILLARAGMIWAGEVTAKHLANRIKTDLRQRLLNHLNALGPVYVGQERSGELTHLATEGIEALDAYFSQYLPQFILALFVPLTFLFFVFPLDPLSASVMLLTAPLIPIFMILIGNMGNSLTKKQWQTLSLMSAHLTDIFQGLTTLKMFGRSREQTQIIAQVSEGYRKTTLEVMRITFLSALALEMIATLSTAVVAVEIGLRLLYGRLEFEQAFFVLLIAPEFYLPLRMLGVRFHAAMSGTEAAKRIFAVLNLTKDASEKSNNHQFIPPYKSFSGNQTSQLLRNPPRIVFHQVGCIYPDGRMALRDVSFEIGSGQKVALVGPSGAGKSTIAYLLLRFIAPTHGQITINEQPLDQIPLEEWRKQIAWLPQKPYLFHDTVMENIRLGSPEASLEEITQAVKMAGAHEFIASLPQDYNTLIGEGGARLSAGEAQRIALARAFLSNAPLIVLDEPTTNLDPETEESITQAHAHLLNNRTTLIIAHRLNTIRNADLIIVLNEGRVEQIGTHASLSQQKGLYQRLVHRYAEQSNKSIPSPPGPVNPPQKIQEELIVPIGATGESLQSFTRMGSITVLQRLLSLLKPFTREIAFSILLGFATIASSIGLMSTSAYIISMAALKPSIAALQVAIVGVRAFGVGRGVFRYLERLVSHNVTFLLLARLRTWFYQAIEPLAPARLLSTHTGDLLSRIIADIASLENFYVRAIVPPFVALATGLSAYFLLAWFHPSISKVLIPFYLFASIGVPLAIHLLGRHPNQRLSTIRTKLYTDIMDGTQGISDLQTYHAQNKRLLDIRCTMEAFNRVLVSLASIGGLQNALVFLAAHLCAWTALWLAIPLTNTGNLYGVFLGVIVLAILTSFEATLPLPQAAQYLESSLHAARRLFEVASSPPEVQDIGSPLSLSKSTQMPPLRLTVRNLRFRYPSSNSYALDGITFDLPPGKRIAIVGPSGSGKTTLVNLLLRFWEFSEGEIMLDGKDIRHFKQEDIRRLMSVVSQNTYLFNASIRENLRIARPQANQDEIEYAIKMAHIYEFICSLPQGFDTHIGERGLLLSAGERQRLALARAFLKNAPFLILDEPTANLDSLTEQQIMQSIYEFMEHRTTLLITHRLVMMDYMNEILVLRYGRVIERGAHANLLKSGGYYYRMWYLQSQVLPMVHTA